MATGLGRARALKALSEINLPSDGLVRADSVTNEVWLTGDYVVRVNRDASLRLHREAILSQALPEGVGYPPLVQHGGEAGRDWLILERVAGVPLSRAWPDLTRTQRRSAVSQLADRLKLLGAMATSEIYFRRIAFLSMRTMLTMGYLSNARVAAAMQMETSLSPFEQKAAGPKPASAVEVAT